MIRWEFNHNCGWCGSKNQSFTTVYCQNTQYISSDITEENYAGRYMLVAICRACGTANIFIVLAPRIAEIRSDIQQTMNLNINHMIQEFLVCYPKNEIELDESIPEIVAEQIQEAQRSEAPRTKCMLYRASMEFALREFGFSEKKGQPLGSIIRELSKKTLIPDALADMCDQVAAFGNWGLHWSETEITDADASAAKSITLAVLEYLFVLPAKVRFAKIRSDEARSAHNRTGIEN